MDRSKLLAFRYWPQIISLVIIAMAFLAYRYFAYYDTHTDDAYVSAHIVNMAALVSGPISNIYIKDNQTVKKGQKLLEIDPRPYLYAMQKAKADLNIAKTKYENDKFAIKVAEERFKQSQVMLRLSEDHVKRYQKLQSKGDLAEIKLLDIQAKMQEQTAIVMAAAQELKIAQENLDINEVLAAKATYAKAQYLYHHTILYAPEDGYITNFNLRHGQYIKKGQGLFALVETKYWWVVSRYRETAIRLIKPGDKAKITLDMYPGKTFHGHVESIGWGINRVQAGEVAPSTLTYMEATEDWIKIAQRFPVRIFFDDLDEQYPLRIGANAATTTYR
ncbi:HlyD family secretion protein [Legionella oakridgensis]|uniref:Multidrug resistance efflux pump n=2 Tax=Legionella oakridgensis TaxID=29423 RepID=W0BCV6_9GAMM|nr:efflux RND transporter periplasmic adaptor subunit [Legionella oakridgensis]AHE66457.1 multidrug resistance efflux pump [Legionella oakridgensis ATCC 33761 = DSM 21215]ETO93804.1 multidrug resistance efflux pump [Legionella oakridgensis RV-2-2007]KTD43968.1 hemolysin D [Legionella oakridgensis]STY19627.1 multidrug efflux system [Legionella longbeachae]